MGSTGIASPSLSNAVDRPDLPRAWGTPPNEGVGSLRSAAQGEPQPGTVQAGKRLGATKVAQQVETDSWVLPRRLAFLNWGFCYLLWKCWTRCFPLTAALAPHLLPTRLRRAVALALRLSLALAICTLVAGSMVLSEEAVNASSRSFAVLLQEFGSLLTVPTVVIVGICSGEVAALLVALLVVPPATHAWKDNRPQAQAAWWGKMIRNMRINTFALLVLALALGVAAPIYASIQMPQPRASLALAAFFVAILVDLVAKPVCLTLVEALILRCPSGLCYALLSHCPFLLDFPNAQAGSWTSRQALLARLEGSRVASSKEGTNPKVVKT